MKQIYLDNAATTSVDPKVLKAMLPYFEKEYGNAGAIYELGRKAKRALDESRQKVANILAAHSGEIIFTGGGTESVNMALLGYARQNKLKGRASGHIITTKIEHDAVLNSYGQLEKEGFTATYLDVDRDGLVSSAQVEKAIQNDTILVSIIYANNEIGTIEPIAAIGKMIRGINEKREKQGLPRIAFHSDACQAAGYLNLHVNDLSVDMLSLNGSKLYGPKGVGVLYARNGLSLEPLIFGGGQERGLRSGTENIAGIVGLATSLEIANSLSKKETLRLTKLRDYFIQKLTKDINKSTLNGHPIKRLPNNISISIYGIEGESAILYLDAKGIACSTGSACNSASLEPSHVITALGRPYEYAHGTLRFTLGRHTTKEEIDYTIDELKKVVKRLREMSAVR